MMEATQGTLVILLSMHRSGSSLTANVFMEQGLSLGPWELFPAHPTNPHGYFEAIPILELTRAVQTLVHGFRDDLPETEEALAGFLATEGRRDDWAEQVPEEYVQRGRSLIRTLLDSGAISGFKDPRNALLWPFWRRVLSAFPGVRVVPVAILRSPHEIAMSLFTRSERGSGYWTCLDLVAVHFRQLQAVIESWNHPVPTVRFGGPHYFGDLEQAVRTCGLDWDPLKAVRVFDECCIHQVPAAVSHRAQHLYDSLSGAALAAPDAQKNAAQLEADGRARDRLQLDRLRQSRAYADETAEALRRTQVRLDQQTESLKLLERQSRLTEERLNQLNREANDTAEALRRTQVRLDQETEALKLLERQLLLTEERLNQSGREANQVWVAYQELRAYVDRLKAHPVLRLALKGRREVRNLVSRLKSRRHAG
jgi:hypothetical protein